MTFLGREGGDSPEQARVWLSPLTGAGLRLALHTGLDVGETRAYLCGAGRLAVGSIQNFIV